MAIKIMIHVDALKRDALPMWILAFLLKEQKYDVLLCSRATYDSYYNAFLPDIVIQSHSWICDNTPELLARRAKRSKFVILYTEGSNFYKFGLLGDVVGHEILRPGNSYRGDAYTKSITRVFTWGNLARQWFLEENILKPEQVKAVGNPRFDEYLNMDNSSEKEGAGFIGRFSSLNPFDKRSMFFAVDNMRGHKGVYYDMDRDLEDFFWYKFASMRIFFELFDKLILDKGLKLSYRPHPNENIGGYGYLRKKYGKKFVLDRSTAFSQWLPKVNCLIMNSSTSIAEGFINKIPVLSIHGIMGDRLYEHSKKYWMDIHSPFLKFCHMPKTVDEAADLIEKAYSRQLQPSPISDELAKLLYDFYDWPRKEPTVVTLCREINEVADMVRSEKRAKESVYIGAYFPVFPKLILGTLRRIASYLKHPIYFKLDREYNYFIWHAKKYAAIAKNIVRNNSFTRI